MSMDFLDRERGRIADFTDPDYRKTHDDDVIPRVILRGRGCMPARPPAPDNPEPSSNT
jgi:hypothetical protein